jgi:hypothetical protein
MLGIKIRDQNKVRQQTPSYRNVFSFLNSSGIFRMLLQRVWQTAYNTIFSIPKIFVRISFHAYNRIRVGQICGGEFAVVPLHTLTVKDIAFEKWFWRQTCINDLQTKFREDRYSEIWSLLKGNNG